MKWVNISKPKELGGLGIKEVQLFNETLLAKWKWRYASENEGSVIFNHKKKYINKRVHGTPQPLYTILYIKRSYTLQKTNPYKRITSQKTRPHVILYQLYHSPKKVHLRKPRSVEEVLKLNFDMTNWRNILCQKIPQIV